MPAPVEPGVLLDGRYRLRERLGVGGMASVYRAEDEQLGRTVAIKLFSPGVLSDTRRQESEARALAGLSDPGLVTLFDAALEGENPHLVMEFIDGEDLAGHLRRGPMPAAGVAELLRSVGGGLAHAHARGLVHRDVKPANILIPRLEGAPRARLADFGIARLVDGTRLTTLGSVLGTAAYLSPEQVAGSAIGPASDVYSLGLVLLEALTGVRAFPGTSAEAALARVHAQPEIPAGVPPAWRALLRAMTASRPEERIPISEALAVREGLDVPVESAGADVPTERLDTPTRVLPPVDAATRPIVDATSAADPASGRRRRRTPLLALAALLGALVIGSAVLLSALPRSSPRVEPTGSRSTSPSTSPPATPVAVSSAAPSARDQALTTLDAALAGREAFAAARASLARAIAAGDSAAAASALATIDALAAAQLVAGRIDTVTASAISAAVARVRGVLGISTPPSDGNGTGKGNGKGNGSPPGHGKPGKPKP
ncbi:MAG: serine/threonine protein kinase [Micrococcales bacterium]|nr:serine/threonine protein kinase [Micrococcales bacterium]